MKALDYLGELLLVKKKNVLTKGFSNILVHFLQIMLLFQIQRNPLTSARHAVIGTCRPQCARPYASAKQ